MARLAAAAWATQVDSCTRMAHTMSAHCHDCGSDLVFGIGEDWQIMTCPRCELAAKLARLKSDYLSLARWARQQNAGNAFADQVRHYAESRIAEWDAPLKDWEP